MQYKTYAEFLKSPEWAKKKTAVRRRSKGICERCGIFSPCMATHHTTYKFGWDCSIAFLAFLCCDCHEFAHGLSTFDPLYNPTFPELEVMISDMGKVKKKS